MGRYPDGYHRVSSVMQVISLADTLTLEPADDLIFQCDVPALAGPDNLVLRAARLLKEATGYPAGALLHLAKRIPAAAGLGGGSSDAAATLRGLDQLWGLALSQERLLELGASLGSDVPFFLYGGTALVEGRGERVAPVPGLAQTWLIILCPPLTLPEKTRRLYSSLTDHHFSQGEHSQALAEALRGGQPLSKALLFNVFEAVAPALFPGLEEYRARLLEAGVQGVHLAGSGPALFALFPDKDAAQATLGRLRGLEAYLAHTLVTDRRTS